MHAALLIRVCILGPFVEQHHGVCKLGIIVPFGSAVFIGIPTIERPTIDRLLLLGGTPAARALGTRNLNICALELALASEDDVCESVVVGRNRGVVDRDDKRVRKAGTAVVRGVGRAAFDVHVVAAVAAIPLKSVLLVVLNGEIRAILQVELIVVAEIDGMNVASAGAIHGKRSVIERGRDILVCARRHPIPLGGIRGGTNAGHACIDILKHERMPPKGDTFVGKLQGMVVAIDGEIVIKVKTSGFGIDKELNKRTLKDRKKTREISVKQKSRSFERLKHVSGAP